MVFAQRRTIAKLPNLAVYNHVNQRKMTGKLNSRSEKTDFEDELLRELREQRYYNLYITTYISVTHREPVFGKFYPPKKTFSKVLLKRPIIRDFYYSGNFGLHWNFSFLP